MRRRVRRRADGDHRPANDEPGHGIEGDTAAVDHRQARFDAGRLDRLGVVSQEPASVPIPEDEATTANREMATVGRQGFRDQLGMVGVKVGVFGGARGSSP